MEYYSKCNVCGRISCYTDDDIKNNTKQAMITGLAALSTVTNAVAGTRYDMYESGKIANRASDKVVDYTKCPICGSKDTILVTKKFAKYSNKMNGSYNIDELAKEANEYLKKEDYENAFCFATMILNEDETNYDAYLIRFLSSYEVKSLKDFDNFIVDYSDNQHFKNLLSIANDSQKKKLLSQCEKNKFEFIVFNSKKILEEKDDENLIEKIDYYISELEQFDNKDSKELINELNEKKNEILYETGYSLMQENKISSLIEAIDIFNKISDYKDSNDMLNKCNELLNQKNKEKKRNTIIGVVCVTIFILFVIVISVLGSIKENKENYNKAINLFNSGNYYELFHNYYSNLKYSDKNMINDKIIDEISKSKWKSTRKINYRNFKGMDGECSGNEVIEINDKIVNHYIVCYVNDEEKQYDYTAAQKIIFSVDKVGDDKVTLRFFENGDLLLYIKKDNDIIISREYYYKGESNANNLLFEKEK